MMAGPRMTMKSEGKMQPTVGSAQVLDRDHLGAVGLAGEQNARVDQLIDDRPIPCPRQDDRAGPAVTLGAALLRAGRAIDEPQPVEQHRQRFRTTQLHDASAPPQPHALSWSARHAADNARTGDRLPA